MYDKHAIIASNILKKIYAYCFCTIDITVAIKATKSAKGMVKIYSCQKKSIKID